MSRNCPKCLSLACDITSTRNKMLTPGDHEVVIDSVYGHEHAQKVVEAARADYEDEFGE